MRMEENNMFILSIVVVVVNLLLLGGIMLAEKSDVGTVIVSMFLLVPSVILGLMIIMGGR